MPSATRRGGRKEKESVRCWFDCENPRGLHVVVIVFCLLAGRSQADTVEGPAGAAVGPSLCGLMGSLGRCEYSANRTRSKSSAADWWPAVEPPFSFVYDGKTSTTLLPSWKQTAEKNQQQDGTHYVTTWLDPKTGLKVCNGHGLQGFSRRRLGAALREHRHARYADPGEGPGIGHRLGDPRQRGRGPRPDQRRRLQPAVVPADGAAP